MQTSPWPALIQQLEDLPAPRVARTCRHNLIDILVIAFCVVICGADGWDDFVSSCGRFAVLCPGRRPVMSGRHNWTRYER